MSNVRGADSFDPVDEVLPVTPVEVGEIVARANEGSEQREIGFVALPVPCWSPYCCPLDDEGADQVGPSNFPNQTPTRTSTRADRSRACCAPLAATVVLPVTPMTFCDRPRFVAMRTSMTANPLRHRCSWPSAETPLR